MNINEIRPGMEVRCVGAKHGWNVPQMRNMVGKIVTIKKVRDPYTVEVEGCLTGHGGYFLWSPEDFEPICHTVITEPTDEEYIYILGV